MKHLNKRVSCVMGCFKTTRKPRTVYKQACHRSVDDLGQRTMVYCIVTLEIPKDTRIHLSTCSNRKCRAARAYTRRIQYVPTDCEFADGQKWRMPLKRFLNEAKDIKKAFSYFNASYAYVVDTEQTPEEPFDETDEVYASGIHFFETLQDALNY